MKRISIFFILLVFSYLLKAQNEMDALRYSFTMHAGTARYMGMSGAFGALGADFSSISTNPAGIGVFKKSRFMFSPVFMMNTSEAEYKNENTINEKLFFKLNNLGFVLNLKAYDDDDTGWKSVAFGIGYNSLRNLSRNITIKGFNDESSMLDQFMLNSDYTEPNGLPEVEYYAYNAYLTDVNMTDTLYSHPYLFNYAVNQEKITSVKGGIGEYVFALGGNFADKFQIGASFGIQNVRYIMTSEYTEESELTDLESYTFKENLETKGTGYTFKFGLIYRPVNFIRIGAAFHTPTFYKLKDVFSYSMVSNWRVPPDPGYPDVYSWYYDTEEANNQEIEEYEYTYELYTPMRLVTSVALVLARYGILSADYEYVNYGRARLRAEDWSFEQENNAIKENYRSGHNFRLGTEIRLAPIYLRGGVSYYGSPTLAKMNAEGCIKGYSLGVGLKSYNTYIDIAFNHSYYDQTYQLYDYGDGIENSALSLTEDHIVFTIGFKF